MDEGTVFQARPGGSLRPGVRLNDMFEIERLIAEGGMGEVYKGVALASGDAVAIKLVRPEMARHPEALALFKREAAILHNLLHEAIVRYYVFTIEPELQRAYIAMEFVDGVSLQKRLASGPLSTAEVRVLLARIGGALAQAHASGVVHRDISSDNIILPNGEPRRAKIVDFGIARAAQANEGTIIGGGFAGKNKYVSPEQLGLAGGEVTPKSDIYSFGLVIAEALRGRPIDMGGTQAEVIEKRKRVPDLSDIDVALRPLLTAMLAPNPDDRPPSMAEVAIWGETGEPTRIAQSPAVAPAAGNGRGLAALAAAVVVVGLSATAAYVLRGGPPGATVPTIAASSPTASALPPLPPPPSVTPSATPATPVAVPTAAEETPSKQALLDQLPPRAPQGEIALKAGSVGAPLEVELPAFADPGGQGLAVHAAPQPPAGLTLHDLGGGRSALQGTPSVAGQFSFEVVAINHNGKSARMTVALVVTAAPPQPPRSALDLEPATVGAPYTAGLPPFRSPEKLTLRAERLPEGLAFGDLGGGLSQITGSPSKAGRFAFEIVATAPGGAEGRMTVNIEVAPAAAATSAASPSPSTSVSSEPTPTPTATPSPAAKVGPAEVAVFLAARNAAPCFFVRADDDAGLRFLALAADRNAMERFDADFHRAFGSDPETRAELVTPDQCPVVELMKALARNGPAPPKVTLDSVAVGSAHPLSGAVTGLSKRSLLLLAVGDDGRAVKVRAPLADDGQSASFSLGMTGDADSYGKPELLVAVASDRPLAGLDGFRAGPSTDLARKIAAQSVSAGVAGAYALFKFVQ